MCVCVCVCVCQLASVCKTQCREKSGCAKGITDPLLHGVSFLKLEQSDWPLEFTDRLKLHDHGRELPPNTYQ